MRKEEMLQVNCRSEAWENLNEKANKVLKIDLVRKLFPENVTHIF